jgi:DNA-binding transcriptional ArsR family regulator
MVDIFEAIADPTRRQLLDVLLEAQLVGGSGEMTVSQLVEQTKLGQPAVSKHLKTLSDVGLVAARAEGQKRFYTVTPEPLEEIEDWIINFLSLGFDDEAETQEISVVLSDAGAKLGNWLTRLTSQLSEKVEERVGQVDIDPKALGKDLGRKLADTKADATKEVRKIERQAKKKVNEVVGEIKSEAKSMAKTAKSKLPGKK